METKLKPYWKTIEQEFEKEKIIYRKNQWFFKWIIKNFPKDVEASYSFDDIGEDCIRCFIYLKQNEEDTIKIINWLKSLLKNKWKIEKFWREDKGYFSYKIEREYKYNDYLLFIEETANIDGCKIEKKRKMKTIYVTDCEKKSTIMN